MERFMRTFSGTIAVSLLSFAGCAPTIPHELANARTAYQHAAGSRASDLSPAELHKAKEALVKAEESWTWDPDVGADQRFVVRRGAQGAARRGDGRHGARAAADDERRSNRSTAPSTRLPSAPPVS